MGIWVEKRGVPSGREVRGTPRGAGPDVPTCSASGPGAASPARRNPRLKKRRNAMRSRGTIPAPSRSQAPPHRPRAAGTPPPRHAPSRSVRPRHAPHLLRGAAAPRGSEKRGWAGDAGDEGSDIALQQGVEVSGVGRGSRGGPDVGSGPGCHSPGGSQGWESQCGVVKEEPGVERGRPCGERIRASLPSLGGSALERRAGSGAGTGCAVTGLGEQQSPSLLNPPLVGIGPGVSPLPLLPSGACFK